MKLDLNRGLEAVPFPRTTEAKQPPLRAVPIESKPPPRSDLLESKASLGSVPPESKPALGSAPFESRQPLRSDLFEAKPPLGSRPLESMKPTIGICPLESRQPPLGICPLESRPPQRKGPIESKQPRPADDPTESSNALIKEYDFCEEETRTVLLGPSRNSPTAGLKGPMPPAAAAPPLPRGCYVSTPNATDITGSLKPAEQARGQGPQSFLSSPLFAVQADGGRGDRVDGGDFSANGQSAEVSSGSGGAQTWFPAFGSALREALERGQPSDQPKVQ
jgi:hypothetical protein